MLSLWTPSKIVSTVKMRFSFIMNRLDASFTRPSPPSLSSSSSLAFRGPLSSLLFIRRDSAISARQSWIVVPDLGSVSAKVPAASSSDGSGSSPILLAKDCRTDSRKYPPGLRGLAQIWPFGNLLSRFGNRDRCAYMYAIAYRKYKYLRAGRFWFRNFNLRSWRSCWFVSQPTGEQPKSLTAQRVIRLSGVGPV